MRTKIQAWITAAVLASVCRLPAAHGEEAIPVPVPPQGQEPTAPPQPTAKLPIGSVAELKSYALERVARAWESISASSMVHGTRTRTYAEVNYVPGPHGPSMTEIGELVNKEKLVFEVANVRDYINTYVAYFSSSGHTLFGGSQSFRLEKRKGGWFVPEWARKVTVYLTDPVPIDLPGASWAQILERDEDGNIVRISSPRVEKGILWFPLCSAGKSGELIVYYSDGNGLAFDLAGGSQIPLVQSSSSFEPVINDTFAFKNTNYVYVVPEGLAPPLVELTLDEEAVVSLYAQAWDKETRTWEVAVGGKTRPQGVFYWSQFSIEPKAPAQVKFDKGIHYIIFEWQKFGTNFLPFCYPPPRPIEYPGKG